jgi:intergrase/recombinase
VAELVLAKESEVVASEWAKELEKTIKVEGGQDLQIFLSTQSAIMDTTTSSTSIFRLFYNGMKFGDRKAA